MNKCLMMLLFVVCNVSAMTEVNNKVCYLDRMPVDVLNYIAGFLMETEEEFVERTKDLIDPLLNIAMIKPSPLQVLCPDKASSIKIQKDLEMTQLGRYKTYKQLYIEKDGVMYISPLDNKPDYRCVALSRDCNRIGIYRSEQFFRSPHENINYMYFLEIQKVELQKNEKNEGIIVLGEKYKLSDTHHPQWIGFNKQGTLFIAHYNNMWTQKSEHKIFSLKNLGSDKPQAMIQDTNKLQTYLRDKFVCNRYIQGR